MWKLRRVSPVPTHLHRYSYEVLSLPLRGTRTFVGEGWGLPWFSKELRIGEGPECREHLFIVYKCKYVEGCV